MNVPGDGLTPYESQFGDVVPFGRYRVGAGTKTKVKTIGLVIGNEQNQCAAANINVGVANGSILLEINSANAYESFALGLSTHQTAFGWEDLPNYWQSANQLFNFGDGIVVPSGQLIRLRTGTGSSVSRSWKGTLFGIESGAPVIVKGVANVTATATLDIVSYTPSADFTLLSFSVEPLQNSCLGLARLLVNDKMVFDYGRVGMINDCVVPFDQHCSVSGEGYGAGGIFFNTWGMDFYPGESISHGINMWDTNLAVYQSLVFGDNASLSAGAVYPVEDDVEVGVTYGPTGADFTGTVTLPAVGDVRSGTTYGADGTEFTGTLVAGGGGNTYSRGRVVNS